MDEDINTEEQNGEVVSSELQKYMGATIIVNDKVRIDSTVLRAAQLSESCITKESVEFINGKRKVKLGLLGTLRRKKTFLRALIACHGVISDACKAAGVTRPTIYNWIEKDPEFTQAMSIIEEDAVDFGESQLFKNIERGHEASIIFFLKTRGKKRGYDEYGNTTGKSELQQRIEDRTDDELKDQNRALEEKIDPSS